MFNSEILDVAIGLIFVYLLLSLMCSAANEIIELWLKNRSADLERGLRELLNDDKGTGLVKDLYSHHLVNGLFKGQYNEALYSGFSGWVKRLFGRGQLPSYIPARNFALALMDMIPRVTPPTAPAAPGSDAPAEPKSGAAYAMASTPTAPSAAQVVVNVAGSATVPGSTESTASADQQKASIANLRAAIQNLGSPQLSEALTALVDAAGNDVAKVRQNIEDWYNSSMDRVSGWYKRRSQIIVLVIGLIVAIAVNADSLAITKRLWTDRALRESLVSAADAYAKANANANVSSKPTPTPTPTPIAGSPASTTSSTPKPSPTPKASPTPLAAATPATTSSPAAATPTPTGSPTPVPCWSEECKDKDSPQCKLKKAKCEIEGLGLPIGWTPPEDKWPGLHFWTSDFWTDWLIQLRLHGFGWLLTAFAVSLGAPFWFDMLNKFIVVRSTVKPKEKSPDEPSKS
jgi:hypothetical protein